MLDKLFFLQSYNFYGGEIGNLLSRLEQAGVFSYMLPFLLIFALVYGILTKMKLFGSEENQMINAVIALSVGLMALQFGIVSAFFAEILPRLGVVLSIVLTVLIVVGLFGSNKDTGFLKFFMWGSLAVALIIVFQSLEIFRYSTDYFLGFFSPTVWALIIFLGLIIAIVASARKSEPDTIGGNLKKLFGDR